MQNPGGKIPRVGVSIHVPGYPSCLGLGNNRKDRSGLDPAGPLFQKNNARIGVYSDQTGILALLLQTRCVSPMHRSRRHRTCNRSLLLHLDFGPYSRALIVKDVMASSPRFVPNLPDPPFSSATTCEQVPLVAAPCTRRRPRLSFYGNLGA